MCPFTPWPSQTANRRTPKGSLDSRIAMSWFIFGCLPFVPAFVRVAKLICMFLWMGYNLAALDVTSSVAE